MTRIAERFVELRARGERALVPFLTAGDPDLEATERLALALVEAGADLLEIGVPFSDPIAEGPVIQRASERSLQRGTTLRRVLVTVERLRQRVDIPLLLMGYANPFFAMGAEGFAQAASRAGIDGVIIPDLPPEEGVEFYRACAERGVDAVLLAAPTTSDARLAMLASKTAGFLYYVSTTGVTGARHELAGGIEKAVERVRRSSTVPVCVGFGVSRPEHARELAAYADGVVVGSAFVDRIERAENLDSAIEEVGRFARELKAPLRR